jgi:hypothetical protein
MKAIFAVDPGGHTGVASAILDETKPRAIDAVRNRIHGLSTTLTGPEEAQIRELYKLWLDFKTHAVRTGLLDPSQVELVVEDFVLRGGQTSGGRAGTSPERIAWGFLGYRMGRHDQWKSQHKLAHFSPVIWQQPGQAARYWNKNILQEADAWVRGRPHERSAFGHMIFRVNTLMNERRFAN